MSEFNIDSIRKYIHVNKGKVEEEPNIPHQTNETLSDLESLKSIEMEARLSFSKVNEETYWQDIPYSLTELKRVGRKQVQQNKAMEDSNNISSVHEEDKKNLLCTVKYDILENSEKQMKNMQKMFIRESSSFADQFKSQRLDIIHKDAIINRLSKVIIHQELTILDIKNQLHNFIDQDPALCHLVADPNTIK